jgi:predicted O-methyltransferase YrrM
MPKTITQLRGLLDSVGGYMMPEAMAVWDTLLEFQKTNKISGGILEIGVFEGKSALLLGLHCAKDEPLVLVDPYDFGAREAVRELTGKDPLYILSDSRLVEQQPELVRLAGTFRWIHIDGDHTSRGIRNDLDICNRLLGDNGIICLDDFFTASFPQVTRVAFEFLNDHPDDLRLFFCGYNKGYLCRPKKERDYVDFLKTGLIQELKNRELTECTVFKTDDPAACSCVGVSFRFGDQDFYGVDGEPLLL